MIETIFSLIQNICDTINEFMAMIGNVIGYYAINYPDAFRLIVCLPLMTVFIIIFIAFVIIIYN